VGPVWECVDSNGSLVISDRTKTGRVWITQQGFIGVGTEPASVFTARSAVGCELQLQATSGNNSQDATIKGQSWVGSAGGGYGLAVQGMQARGTYAAPTPTQTDDVLLRLEGWGTRTTTSGNNFGGAINIAAGSAWAVGSEETYISFITTPASSASYYERVRITGAGYVGIGTSVPAFPTDIVSDQGYILRVQNTSNFAGIVIDTAITTGADSVLSFRSAGLECAVIQYDYNEDRLTLFTGARDAAMSTLTCDTNSRVGILTTTPYYELDVLGDCNVSGKYLIAFASPANVMASLVAGGSLLVGTNYYYEVTAVGAGGETVAAGEASVTPTAAGTQMANITWSAVAGATSYRIYRSNTSGSYVTPSLAGTSTTTTFNDAGVALTAGAPPAVGTAFTVKINSNGDSWFNAGNVGIGTSSPSTLLDLYSKSFTTIHVVGDYNSTNSYCSVQLDNFSGAGTNGGARFVGRAARGSNAAPAATGTGDLLTTIAGTGYQGAAWAESTAIQLVSNAAWTASDYGSYIRFLTTANGSISETEKMRIDSAGNVGIGTSAPKGLLQVGPTSDSNYDTSTVILPGSIRLAGYSAATPVCVLAAQDNSGVNSLGIQFRTSVSGAIYDRLIITSNGKVGINTTSPAEALTVNGGVQVTGTFAVGGANTGGIDINPPGALRIVSFGPSAGVSNRIEFWQSDNTGAIVRTPLQIGTPYGTVMIQWNQGYQSSYYLDVAVDSAAKPATNTWTVPSDVRLKQNVKPLEGGLSIINQIVPVEAEYNGLRGTPEGQRVVSVIVEDLKKILPGCCPSYKGKLRESDAEETEIFGFNSHEILFHLILAVQQLSAIVEKKNNRNRTK
jgi:hypothetical protein